MSLEKHVLNLIQVQYPEDIKKISYRNIIELPLIIEKYLAAHFDLLMRISQLENKRNEVYGKRYQYYKEDYAFSLSASEIKNYMEADSEYNKVKRDLSIYEAFFKQIVEIITELRSLQYIVKSQLEYQKLIGGE